LQELKDKVEAGKMSLGDALRISLPELRGKVSDNKLVWLANELQGYSQAMDYYTQQTHNLPPYREVGGRLLVADPGGNLAVCAHPIAERKKFFVATPLPWLEDLIMQIDTETVTYVEMPELTQYTGGRLGTIVCECRKANVIYIVGQFRKYFFNILNDCIASQQPSAPPA